MYSKRAFVHWYVGEGESSQGVPDVLLMQTEDWDLGCSMLGALALQRLPRVAHATPLLAFVVGLGLKLTLVLPLLSDGFKSLLVPSSLVSRLAPGALEWSRHLHKFDDWPRFFASLDIFRNDHMDELMARIWNKLMHIIHGNGVVPPPTTELAATRSHRNTLRRRMLRRTQTDKLSSAMFIVDLQLRSLRSAVTDLHAKFSIEDGHPGESITPFSRDTLLQVRATMPILQRSDAHLPTTVLRRSFEILATMPAQAPVLPEHIERAAREPPAAPKAHAEVRTPLPEATADDLPQEEEFFSAEEDFIDPCGTLPQPEGDIEEAGCQEPHVMARQSFAQLPSVGTWLSCRWSKLGTLTSASSATFAGPLPEEGPLCDIPWRDDEASGWDSHVMARRSFAQLPSVGTWLSGKWSKMETFMAASAATLSGPLPQEGPLCDILWTDFETEYKHDLVDLAFSRLTDWEIYENLWGVSRQGFAFLWHNRDLDNARRFLQSHGIGYEDALAYFDPEEDCNVNDFLLKDSVARADTVSIDDVTLEIRGLLIRHPLRSGNSYRDELTHESIFWDWIAKAGLNGPQFMDLCVRMAVDLRRSPAGSSDMEWTPAAPTTDAGNLLERARKVLNLPAPDDSSTACEQLYQCNISGEDPGPATSGMHDAPDAPAHDDAAIGLPSSACSKVADWVACARNPSIHRHGGRKSVKHRAARRHKPPGLEKRGGKHVSN
jgi:hypothetical protein